MKISGNKILITGATQGIGKALALKLLEKDNQIIAVGRNPENLQELSVLDSRVIPFRCDIGKSEDLEALTEFVKHYHPDTNILINNAGLQYNYQFSEAANITDKIEEEINVNLTAPIKLTAMLLPVLEKNENAAIVNVSSGLGLVPKPQAPVYCSTKGGIHIFSQSLRMQMDKVKVFEIIPPVVDTEMTRGRGKNKISPDKLVDEFLIAFEKNNYEVSIGKVKLLKIINRISPLLARKIIEKGSKTES